MSCKHCDNLYYIKVSDEKIFWNALRELVHEGCDFEIRANANNRRDGFVSASFWVHGIGCKSYGIVMKHVYGTCKACGLIHAGQSDCSKAVRFGSYRDMPPTAEKQISWDKYCGRSVSGRSMRDVAKQACVIICLVLAFASLAVASVSFFNHYYELGRGRGVMHTTTIRKHTFVNGSDHQYDFEQTCAICAGSHKNNATGMSLEVPVAMTPVCFYCAVTYDPYVGHRCEDKKAVILPMFNTKETQSNLMDRLRSTVHNFMKQEMMNNDKRDEGT